MNCPSLSPSCACYCPHFQGLRYLRLQHFDISQDSPDAMRSPLHTNASPGQQPHSGVESALCCERAAKLVTCTHAGLKKPRGLAWASQSQQCFLRPACYQSRSNPLRASQSNSHVSGGHVSRVNLQGMQVSCYWASRLPWFRRDCEDAHLPSHHCSERYPYEQPNTDTAMHGQIAAISGA